MGWMDDLGGILERYAAAPQGQPSASTHEDFDKLTQAAPASVVADGLAAAFRSEATPPFAQMLAQLFGRSPGPQQSNTLNALISVLGPPVAAQLLSRHGAEVPAASLRQGQQDVPPDSAAQVSPQAVEKMAAEAEKKDPSIVDRISQLYAQQPQLVKTLGAAALSVVMAQVLQRQRAR